MMKVEFTKRALKDLGELDVAIQERVLSSISTMISSPQSVDIKKLNY